MHLDYQKHSIIIDKRSWSKLQSKKACQFALTSDELLAGSFTVPFPQASNRSLGRGSFLRGLVLFFSLISALSIGKLSFRSPGCSSELFWLDPLPTCSVPGISTMFPQSGLAGTFTPQVSGLWVHIHRKTRKGGQKKNSGL